MIKHIILVFLVSTLSSFANVADYQAIEAQEREAFSKALKVELKKQLKYASKTVNKLYKSINYEPIWVDKDYLTYHSEMLVTELESDFKKGLYPELVEAYEKLMPKDNSIFISDSIEDKVKVEVAIMGLYAKSINRILKNKKSKYTALTLLQKAVKEKSIMAAIDEISNERTIDKLFRQDMNISILEEEQEKYRELATRLMGEDAKDRLKAMYELLSYEPIWITEEGVTSYTKTLFNEIESDITLDKDSTIYTSYQQLKTATHPIEKDAIADREFALAKLYQDFMSYTLYGDINWKKFLHTLHKTKKHGVWTVHPILETPESLLIESLKYNSLEGAFKKAKPAFPLYARYLGAFKRYLHIVEQGGWKLLGSFDNLKPGMSASIVPALRERLRREGDYACDRNETGNDYTGCIVDAVKKFQGRHGLETEGYVGKMTRKALNETAEEKLKKLKLNIDRIKWIKRGDDQYHIFINIPSYTMYMFDDLEMIQSMRVITGRKGHETPVFYGRVRTIVLNPYWRIPASIIRHETIPKLKKDPGYTNKKKIEIHKGYSEHSPRVNPYKVNWHKYGKRLPPYKFMQSPGVHNALGKVKYLFPNKYSVYMHDTNEKYLFVKDYRALSHGCVRLHKPFELLETFSKIEPNIDYEKSKNILATNKKTPIRLVKTIPVDIVYLTVLVGDDGTVKFYDDVYGYDKMQLDTFKK